MENPTLTDKLRAIILKETAKDVKDMDGDLVAECVDFLTELEGGKPSAAHLEESRARLMSAFDERR